MINDRNKLGNKAYKELRFLYLLTMGLIFSCFVKNIYQIFDPTNPPILFKILNIVSPIVTLIYLLIVIKRKRELTKKINDRIYKIFSKN